MNSNSFWAALLLYNVATLVSVVLRVTLMQCVFYIENPVLPFLSGKIEIISFFNGDLFTLVITPLVGEELLLVIIFCSYFRSDIWRIYSNATSIHVAIHPPLSLPRLNIYESMPVIKLMEIYTTFGAHPGKHEHSEECYLVESLFSPFFSIYQLLKQEYVFLRFYKRYISTKTEPL